MFLDYVNHMDKINYGLGYTLQLKRSHNGNSIYRTIGDEAKLDIKDNNLVCKTSNTII